MLCAFADAAGPICAHAKSIAFTQPKLNVKQQQALYVEYTAYALVQFVVQKHVSSTVSSALCLLHCPMRGETLLLVHLEHGAKSLHMLQVSLLMSCKQVSAVAPCHLAFCDQLLSACSVAPNSCSACYLLPQEVCIYRHSMSVHLYTYGHAAVPPAS